MAGIQESLEPTVNETESLIQEQIESVRQALEKHSNKLREKAEHDSSQILARAREEGEKALVQARQEAKAESELILSRAKEEAEQIVRESREQAARSRQESTRIINDTREKTSEVIKEIIERGTTQAQNEFARVSAEARNRTAELMNKLNQSVDQIIGQAGNNVKIEIERLAVLIAEARSDLQPLNEPASKEADIKPQQQPAAETVAPAAPVSQKTESTPHNPADRRSAPLKESEEGKLFKGCIKLEMVPPFDQERLESVPPWLSRLPGLKVISTGGYTRANRWITTYTIDLEQPVLLMKALKNMPPVRDVSENKGSIVITLK